MSSGASPRWGSLCPSRSHQRADRPSQGRSKVDSLNRIAVFLTAGLLLAVLGTIASAATVVNIELWDKGTSMEMPTGLTYAAPGLDLTRRRGSSRRSVRPGSCAKPPRQRRRTRVPLPHPCRHGLRRSRSSPTRHLALANAKGSATRLIRLGRVRVRKRISSCATTKQRNQPSAEKQSHCNGGIGAGPPTCDDRRTGRQETDSQ